MTTTAVNSPPAPHIRRWRCWLFAASVLAEALTTAAWQTRECWLAGAIHAWLVNGPVEPADAVFILGGGGQFCSFEAVRLYREGHAAKVLFPHIKPGAGEPVATVGRETVHLGKVLDHHTILAAARDEIAAFRAWAERAQTRVVLVPTGPSVGARTLRRICHSCVGHRSRSARLPLAGTVSAVEERRQWLDRETVPESAREFIGEEIRPLSQEMPMIRAWAATIQIARLLLPAEPFAMRRVAWLAKAAVGPTWHRACNPLWVGAALFRHQLMADEAGPVGAGERVGFARVLRL